MLSRKARFRSSAHSWLPACCASFLMEKMWGRGRNSSTLFSTGHHLEGGREEKQSVFSVPLLGRASALGTCSFVPQMAVDSPHYATDS